MKKKKSPIFSAISNVNILMSMHSMFLPFTSVSFYIVTYFTWLTAILLSFLKLISKKLNSVHCIMKLDKTK